MAKHHGKDGVVKSGSNAIANVTKFTVDEAVGTADSTDMESTAEEHLVGLPSWNASIDCYYNTADTTGQESLDVGDSITLGLYSDGSASGKKYLTGTATVIGRKVEADMGSTVKLSITCKGNGALAKATVGA